MIKYLQLNNDKEFNLLFFRNVIMNFIYISLCRTQLFKLYINYAIMFPIEKQSLPHEKNFVSDSFRPRNMSSNCGDEWLKEKHLTLQYGIRYS
jgi:hypothetical protein